MILKPHTVVVLPGTVKGSYCFVIKQLLISTQVRQDIFQRFCAQEQERLSKSRQVQMKPLNMQENNVFFLTLVQHKSGNMYYVFYYHFLLSVIYFDTATLRNRNILPPNNVKMFFIKFLNFSRFSQTMGHYVVHYLVMLCVIVLLL